MSNCKIRAGDVVLIMTEIDRYHNKIGIVLSLGSEETAVLVGIENVKFRHSFTTMTVLLKQ